MDSPILTKRGGEIIEELGNCSPRQVEALFPKIIDLIREETKVKKKSGRLNISQLLPFSFLKPKLN